MTLDGYINALLRSASGLATVANLALPRAFLERIGGRSIRAHYRLTQRRFPRDDTPDQPLDAPAGEQPAHSSRSIRRLERPAIAIAPARARTGAVPHLRGYRWSDDATPADPWPLETGTSTGRDLAVTVASTLASRGVVTVADEIVERSRPDAAGSTDESNLLNGAGVPTDWLELVRAAPAAFEQAIRGFRALDAAQPHDPALVRWQLPTDRTERGRGDGSLLDCLEHVASLMSGARHVVVAETAHGASLARRLCGLSNVEIVASPLPVGQWACDNAVVGHVGSGGPAAILMPRYASRNEQHSALMPGDCLAPWALAGAVEAIARSPLHFQGGNVMAVALPGGERALLLGEAELYRNVALGISQAQVVEALRAEFGVERVEILPAVSFHLDVEMTLRRVGGAVVACVVDELAAARIAVRCGLEALERSGLISGKQRGTLARDVDRGDALAAWSVVQRALGPVVAGNSAAVASIGSAWRMRAVDYPLATLSRFCVALDILAAASTSAKELSGAGVAAAAKLYLGSFQRRAAERERLHVALASLGLEVRGVPSMSDEECILSYLNGIHTPDAYLMPVWGGVLSELDAAAGVALSAALGGVRVIPVASAGVQAGHGGLHCMCSVVPRIARAMPEAFS